MTEQDGEINFGINHPDEWTYAKISLINANTGKSDTTSATPSKMAKLSVNQNGQYWVEAKINVNGETFDAFETIEVQSARDNGIRIFESLSIPERQIFIVFGIIIVVAAVGLRIRK